MQTIDAGQLKLLIENKKAIIIDVREDFEYRNGHVPGAKNLPLSQLEEKYQDITDGNYIICQSGARSARACQYLLAKGIETINISGGTSAWDGQLDFD